MISIVLVDGQDFARVGLEKILVENGMKVLATTSSYADAPALIHKTCPHIVLLDIHLPALAGLITLQKILRDDSHLKVIVLNAENNSTVAAMAYQAGALGYLSKSATIAELIQAIRQIFKGERYISPQLAKLLAFKQLDTVPDSPFTLLSERELQIAILIVSGIRPLDIAKQLHLSPKTVNGYRYRIFEKLNIDSDVALTKLAIQHHLIKL